MDLKTNLGMRIKQLRKAGGWTQQILADKARMEYPYLGAIERGEKNPTLDFIEKISRGLEIEICQLFLFSNNDLKLIEGIKEEEIEDILNLYSKKKKKKLMAIIYAILNLNEKK